ncbi:hypothetical protein BC936DRAFT_149776 [Jimgerdemannia flammicorona]|uniref:Uncharacterized protein n=2 Tax=Jimgerdemannia flammicorona TaxID=994334 RepID=A0A433DJU7_9FUNG|nr:hypothetical protein BC936DRAFT_149776 [Jimgerdemannia flammicorona]RUS30585.1 hypothetical protein BC938DRAFT_479213 [Jimgerdemannia flammicorona]
MHEIIEIYLAIRAHEPAHVLYHTDNGDLDLAAEVDLPAHILQRNLLRRGDDDRTVDARFLKEGGDAEMLVGCAWRSVDEEIVELAPFDVTEESFDEI